MQLIDYVVLAAYFLGVLWVGWYFLNKQTAADEYLVGNRKMGATHLGLSVVATDVGGGFSIGLGGIGFTMGISGSWMLFTGLIGAWVAAVILIPKVKRLDELHGWRSFPDLLGHLYDKKVARVAALMSAIGYGAFCGAQVLAGATLAKGAFELDLTTSVIIMGLIVIGYTAMGGLEAVVYTDTVQWAILFIGLAFFAVPEAWSAVDGWSGLKEQVPAGHLDLTNIGWPTFVEWGLTILPIWFVAMTLYQRIFAARDVKTAKRAWYFAGLLEWPLIAFLGTFLGVCGRALYPDAKPEAALPQLLAEQLPVGIAGLVVAAFFSAVMSTADSCLLASTGHFVHDFKREGPQDDRKTLRLSRIYAVVIGTVAIGLAMLSESVIDAVMGAYKLLVGGLVVPTLGGLFWKGATSRGALAAVVFGSGSTVAFMLRPDWVWHGKAMFGALPISLAAYVIVSLLDRKGAHPRKLPS